VPARHEEMLQGNDLKEFGGLQSLHVRLFHIVVELQDKLLHGMFSTLGKPLLLIQNVNLISKERLNVM